MRNFFILYLISFVTLSAETFYAKGEPYNKFVIKSATSGQVIFTNYALESKNVKNKIIIKIDDKAEQINKKYLQEKLLISENILDLNQKIYKKVFSLKSKAVVDKDNLLLKILNTKLKIIDLNNRIELLKDKLSKKIYKIDNAYLAKLYVRKGNYVSFGTALFDMYDISKIRLTIFIPVKDIDIIKNSQILIDDIKRDDAKIEKIYKVVNQEFISSYRVDIIITNKNKNISKLRKIEFEKIVFPI
jgi:hypothetical protein